jgi:transcriptional regulator of acetoin/glycerol metabolism
MAQKRTKVQQERVLKALESSLGVVTTALRNSDVTRTTYYRWLA